MLTRDLFSAIMATTVFSLICALIFLLLDGIDVSLTEAAVGAGISTILFLSTLKHTNVEIKASRKSSIPLVVLFLLTLSLLIYAISDLPDFGKSIVTTNSEVTRHYINESKNEMGIPNMVTSILAGYRGFDTLGEVVVIFIAGISVLGILREKKGK